MVSIIHSCPHGSPGGVGTKEDCPTSVGSCLDNAVGNGIGYGVKFIRRNCKAASVITVMPVMRTASLLLLISRTNNTEEISDAGSKIGSMYLGAVMYELLVRNNPIIEPLMGIQS
jgi:hypothetical protein